MMSKILATVAVAATSLSMASACGWFNEACCHIAPNNPNIGQCFEERNVCWEGKCMSCGTNGMIKCPTEPACDDGYLVNDDGWCYTAPGQAPPADFSCDGGCPHGSVCFYGRCETCGANGQPKCDEGAPCGNGLVINDDDFCQTAPHCGWVNEACCPGDVCLDDSVCQGGTCAAAPEPVAPVTKDGKDGKEGGKAGKGGKFGKFGKGH